jgi:hypothetical protein
MEDINNNFIERIKNSSLIRKDGKINSPAIKSVRNTQLIQEIIQSTNYLNNDISFSQRWWHIQNGKNVPTCTECNKELMWNTRLCKYLRFCSQKCAVTSEEASDRTSKHFMGQKLTKEQVQKRKQKRKQNGYYVNREKTIELLSQQKQGEKNPQYGKTPWNFGLCGELNPNFGKRRPGTGLKGEKNPQYGKSPSKQAGRGINGKFNNLHFRSSLEMLYLMYWYENNVNVVSAENIKFRVKYINSSGVKRTYSPDFFINETNTLVEIKPENLHTNVEVLQKFNTLKETHTQLVCELVGFKQISNFIQTIIKQNKIDYYIKSGILEISLFQLERLKHNYGDIIRATL